MKRALIVSEGNERLVAILASRDGDPPCFDDLPSFMAAGSRLFPDLRRHERQELPRQQKGDHSFSASSSSSLQKAAQTKCARVAEAVDGQDSDTPGSEDGQEEEEEEEDDDDDDKLCAHRRAEASTLGRRGAGV